MSEFRALQQELFICDDCGKSVSRMIYQTIGNILLYQKGYTTRKEFDKLKYCPECFYDRFPELMQLNEGEEGVNKCGKKLQYIGIWREIIARIKHIEYFCGGCI